MGIKNQEPRIKIKFRCIWDLDLRSKNGAIVIFFDMYYNFLTMLMHPFGTDNANASLWDRQQGIGIKNQEPRIKI